MDLSPNIFREFSIRGVAERDLPAEVVVKIGRALGTYLKRDIHGSLVVVGRDVRLSSPRMSRSLIEGLLQTGINVMDVGIVPTPVQNFATDFFKAEGGVMITASHNPPEDNGLKIRTAETLSGPALQGLYRLAVTEDFIQGQGTVQAQDALTPYLAALEKYVVPGRRLRLVVDGGNGANGPVVRDFLRQQGHDVLELFIEPDGNFPNRSPDPTKAGATEALADMVRSQRVEVGLAYDGDGDRLVVVDEQGNRALGDQIMMILARNVLKAGPAKIVYEILCTQALADDVAAHGGEPVMTPSGYAFVHEAMRQTGAALGGELSGHLFFQEPKFRFDDAILGTVKLLNVIGQSQAPLSALVADLPRYHSSPELRLKCPDEIKARVVDFVKRRFENDYRVDSLDGARIHFEGGWALVRQSNTQPVISMRFEARSAGQLAAIQQRVQPLVEAEIERLQ
ncbi:MAG: phosphomannomutase/phosphoglucomutase [Chloroflexota bacterium]